MPQNDIRHQDHSKRLRIPALKPIATISAKYAFPCFYGLKCISSWFPTQRLLSTQNIFPQQGCLHPRFLPPPLCSVCCGPACILQLSPVQSVICCENSDSGCLTDPLGKPIGRSPAPVFHLRTAAFHADLLHFTSALITLAKPTRRQASQISHSQLLTSCCYACLQMMLLVLL